MISRLKTVAAAAVMLVGSAIAAQASTATCQDAGASRVFTLDPSAGCYAYGNGNINGNAMHDPILNGATTGTGMNMNTFNLVTGPLLTGLTVLDKSDSTGTVLDGALSGNVSGPKTGTISVSGTAGYTSLVLGLKIGGGTGAPDWAAFLIDGDGDYDFNVTGGTGGGMSHVMLYGISDGGGGQGTVPVPASLPLLAAGMLSLAALRRRRRTG